MRVTRPKEIEAVLLLGGPERFLHFVKRVVDEERAWGLFHKGWAKIANSADEPAFPLWPAREYAELCANGLWQEYEPSKIALETLLSELIPMLTKRGLPVAIFPTPSRHSVVITAEQLGNALETEGDKY